MATEPDFKLKSNSQDGAALDVHSASKHSARKGDYIVVLYGDGFEASRWMTPEEMADLRDWITLALAGKEA